MIALLVPLSLLGLACDDTKPGDTGVPVAETDTDSDSDADTDSDSDADSDADSDTDSGVDADGDGAPASTDCDDADPARTPGADERCDGVDNDCDDAIDEDAVDAVTSWADIDGDGYGDDATATTSCDASGVTTGGDCDDADPAENPGATETCDGKDDDCDGETDEPTASDAATWHADTDGDGFGDPAVSIVACDAPDGYVANSSDCDDASADVSPVATERCDGIDDDCDGAIDPDTAADASVWYADADADGFGDATTPTVACDAPTGHVADATDCDDGSAHVSPVATEICNGIDDDCDGTVDPATAADAATWYADTDADGFGDGAEATVSCDAPSGYVADASDCDDADADVHPGATEACSGADDDCDATTSEDGLATFTPDGGVAVDYTALLAGTATTPASVVLATDGELRVCPGTWYTTLDVEADVTITGVGAPEDVILDGAGAGTVVTVATDGVHVELADLTVQNGVGDFPVESFTGGGGVACEGSATELVLDGVRLTGNSADDYGGGLSSTSCDVAVTGSEIIGNDSREAGGFLAYGGRISLTDTVVEANTADGSAGGYAYDADVSCVGSSSVTAGFVSNVGDDETAALELDAGATLVATDCDFGTGGDANDPWDVRTYADAPFLYDYGDDTTVTCDGVRCGTAGTTTVGSSVNAIYPDGHAEGNIVTVTTDTTLESFDAYVAAFADCSVLYAYVLSASSPTATSWTVEAFTGIRNESTGLEWKTFDIGVPLHSGTTYALVVAWPSSCSAYMTYGRDTTAGASEDAGFGTISSYYWDQSSYTGYSGTVTASASTTSGYRAYYMELDYSR